VLCTIAKHMNVPQRPQTIQIRTAGPLKIMPTIASLH
jgi:hypothetical protein